MRDISTESQAAAGSGEHGRAPAAPTLPPDRCTGCGVELAAGNRAQGFGLLCFNCEGLTR